MKNIVFQELDYDNKEIWHDVSDAAKNLVKNLLEKEPSKRLNSNQILSHPWFTHLSEDVNAI